MKSELEATQKELKHVKEELAAANFTQEGWVHEIPGSRLGFSHHPHFYLMTSNV
jgi:hypothetical protein